MIAFSLTNIKDFMSHLLLNETFDHFSFIEGEITTFNTFHIDGFIKKEFFDSNAVLPEYSYWKNVRNFCFFLIKGKRTPLAFQFVFSLAPKNIETLLLQNDHSVQADAVQALYLNIRYNGETLTCITGTSFKTFTMDKTLEHAWDEMTENFFKKKGIDFELLN